MYKLKKEKEIIKIYQNKLEMIQNNSLKKSRLFHFDLITNFEIFSIQTQIKVKQNNVWCMWCYMWWSGRFFQSNLLRHEEQSLNRIFFLLIIYLFLLILVLVFNGKFVMNSLLSSFRVNLHYFTYSLDLSHNSRRWK